MATSGYGSFGYSAATGVYGHKARQKALGAAALLDDRRDLSNWDSAGATIWNDYFFDQPPLLSDGSGNYLILLLP